MKGLFVVLAAFATIAACSPIVGSAPLVGEVLNLEERQSSSNCTEYCSPSAGCVCVNYPKNCSAFYTVQPGDTCVTIAEQYNNFTVTQLYKWNPDMTQTCEALQAYVPVCINVPGYKFTPPVQPADGTHYKPSQTPVPIMPGIISSCESFELVAPDTTVAQLAKENGFKAKKFPKWNGNATSPYANYWACVDA